MATFITVHGAWDGAWCWRPVARRLQAAGHEVFTATLTGSGERAYLASPQKAAVDALLGTDEQGEGTGDTVRADVPAQQAVSRAQGASTPPHAPWLRPRRRGRRQRQPVPRLTDLVHP